ncbi:MAG: hypothetical protein ACR2IK_25555 [Chloroflexota bacterium]
MPVWRRLNHAPVVAVLGVVGAAYTGSLSNPFFGSDTWPWLVSTRLESASDMMRVAFSPIMSGTSFVAEVALFYHPLTALSYSLDQALFGLDPFAFHATNLLIHVAAVGALYSLARGLGGSWWAACAAALLLGLHPIAAATVPSLPRRQDMVVGALLVASMSLLARSTIGQARMRWWPLLLGAMGLFFLALGGKEIAYAGVAVVPFVIACGWCRTRATHSAVPAHLKVAALVVAGFVLLEVVAFGVRWRVLGGLGGYRGSAAAMGSTQGLLEFFVRPYVTDVLWPFQPAMPERLRDWLLVVGGAGVVLGLATTGFRGQRQLLVITGLVWHAGFLALYAVVHTSLSPYLLYVPLAGLGLLVCALLDGAADPVKPAAWPGWARLTRACAWLSAAGSALLLLGVLRTSALFTDYPEFRDAGSASKQFIDQAVACITAAPSGAMVSVENLPHRIDYGSSESQFMDAYVFEAYSLESVVRLLAPESHAVVEVRSIQDVSVRQPRIAVACSEADGQVQISARVQS